MKVHDKMAGLKIHIISFAILLALVVISGQRASEHHVVGDNKGWDTSTDLNSWSSGRLFIVGDVIWFGYNMGEESVVELKSMLELSSCDLSNPIKMYTDGLDQVPLDKEGTRFFASGNSESCKKGLKMHVNVQPIEKDTSHDDDNHLYLEINSKGDHSSDQESPPSPEVGPDDDSPPTPKPKPKPKPKRSPPPPDVGPDDDSPPTPKPKPKPKPKCSPPPLHPKPKPDPKPSSSTMLDGCLFSVVVALFLTYFL